MGRLHYRLFRVSLFTEAQKNRCNIEAFLDDLIAQSVPLSLHKVGNAFFNYALNLTPEAPNRRSYWNVFMNNLPTYVQEKVKNSIIHRAFSNWNSADVKEPSGIMVNRVIDFGTCYNLLDMKLVTCQVNDDGTEIRWMKKPKSVSFFPSLDIRELESPFVPVGHAEYASGKGLTKIKA